MQINTKWHSEGFLKLADMLDPTQNADYAAGFLLDLHEAHQSWDDAVKHYHSAAPEKNVGYHRRVLAELERFLEAGMPAPPANDVAPAATGGARQYRTGIGHTSGDPSGTAGRAGSRSGAGPAGAGADRSRQCRSGQGARRR